MESGYRAGERCRLVNMTTHYALFSGGHDSLVSSHIAMEKGPATEVLHLDTNTGIPQNLEHIEYVCGEYGWPLQIVESPKTLKEFAKEWGFPGPGWHHIAYRWFKERQLEQVASEADGKPHFWAGVRKDESDNRLKAINKTGVVEPADQWIWHKPLAYMTKDRCEEYIDKNSLPRNPVVENIHRSGECYCGAYATRDEELIDLQVHYPEHYEWLKEVEDEVIAERGEDDPRAYWANGSMSPPDVTALKRMRGKTGLLCSDCRAAMHDPASKADW